MPQVEHPIRYTGSELFAEMARDAKARIALVFPDVYEIGMSNYGLRVLYHVINRIPDARAERAFIPWTDMLDKMKCEGVPLASLETRTPLREFDMLGISLQSELGYTNALAALELSGVALRSANRGAQDPLIVGGGPCTVNPLPLEPFFDAFLVGDAEDAVGEMVAVLLGTGNKAERLAGLAEIEGIWVPSVHGRSKRINRRFAKQLNIEDAPTRQVVPIGEIEHDRLVVEIGRGCLRGCRFCQAGFTNRPMRQRPADEILALAEEGLAATGWDEVSLLSFAVSDYPCLDQLLARLNEKLSATRTSISLPSFRGETFSERLGQRLREIKKTGLTFAPETASPRLRRVINKNVTNEEIIETARTAARLGWRHVKLYFMVGLPGETPEDVDASIDFVREILRAVKGLAVNIHIASFVPKPHTPFQWAPFTDIPVLEERIFRMKEEIGSKRVKTKWARPQASFVEALLARGDERMAEVLEGVLQRGGYFQEWSEQFKLERWLEVLEQESIDPGDYTKALDTGHGLPWEFISTGVSRDFLLKEYKRALEGIVLADCLTGPCNGCGADCTNTATVATAQTPGIANEKPSKRMRTTVAGTSHEFRVRIKLEVGEPFRYASHLDLVRAMYRLLRRSGLVLSYSEGFSPHPRASFGFPKPVGVTSRGEYLDFFLAERPAKPVEEILAPHMPRGLGILASRILPPGAQAITKTADILHYEIRPAPPVDEGTLKQRIAGDEYLVHADMQDGHLTLFLGQANRVKLWDSLAKIYNITTPEARLLRAERVDAYVKRGQGLSTLFEESS